jgi:hypothetical protein
MTEQPGVPPEQVVAQQIAGQAELGQAGDAGATLEQIQAAQRAAILPYEQQLSDAMAQMREMQSQLAALQAGVSAAQQAAGPPAVELYANGAAALVRAHAAANPDLPPGTFDGVLKTAASLQDAATRAVTSQDPSEIRQLAGEIRDWVTSFRGKHLDFSGLLADLELLAGAVARLGA